MGDIPGGAIGGDARVRAQSEVDVMALIVCKESRGDMLHLRTAHNRVFSLCNLAVAIDINPGPGWEVGQRVCGQCWRIRQFFVLAQEATQCDGRKRS
jgi:hypothetical protein